MFCGSHFFHTFQIMNWLTREFKNLADLFYPILCITCGDRLAKQEQFLCLHCWSDLPVTNFHFTSDNRVVKLFWGRVQIENATAFYAYNKGSKYQQLIHYIKYKGMKELGYAAGVRFGQALAESDLFNPVDLIVPVPLHPSKEKQRGYNQSEWIAKGLAFSMQKEISTGNLIRKVHTSTQTKKNRFERWENVENIFAVQNPEEFRGKHILLSDDVITTGSTLEACAAELLKIEGVKVSTATLAFADY